MADIKTTAPEVGAVKKMCRKCGTEKPIADFHKSPRNRGGFATQCKRCHLAESQARRAADPEKAKARRHAHYVQNKNAHRAWARLYNEANREHLRQCRRARYLATREAHAKQAKEWRTKNAEKLKRHRADYYRKNRAEIVARRAARPADPETARARRRSYYLHNKDKYLAFWHTRRFRKSGVGEGPGVSKGRVSEVRKVQKDKCAICRTRLKGRGHLDHIVPLALGGRHEDNNLQLLCAPCNLQKGAKHPIDFMQSRGFLL